MRSLVGLLVALFGLELLLTALGVPHVPDIGTWWPVVLILIAIISWQKNPRHIFGPAILFLVGGALLYENLAGLSTNGWEVFWAAIVIVFGLRLMTGKKWEHRMKRRDGDGKDVFVAFSGSEETVHGDYRGGNVSAWFGGTKIDLRNAAVVDGAVLDVFAAFGGVEVLVPKHVRVTTKVIPLFGGASNKTQPAGDPAVTLTVSGTALFGGVDIKN